MNKVSGPLELYIRSQAGNRVSSSINESHRIFGGLEGEAYGWDINTVLLMLIAKQKTG